MPERTLTSFMTESCVCLGEERLSGLKAVSVVSGRCMKKWMSHLVCVKVGGVHVIKRGNSATIKAESDLQL